MITTVNVGSPTNQMIYTDTAMGNSVDGVKSTSAEVLSITVNNLLNVSASSYVKLFNLLSGSVVLGTTAPDQIIFAPAGNIVTAVFFNEGNIGVTFATGLSAACVTTGGTAGTVAPAEPVIVTISFI